MTRNKNHTSGFFIRAAKLPDFILYRCWRGPSPDLPALDGVPPAADVLVHMAGHTAEEREAVWEGGGVCHHGDADCPRAHEFQADRPACLGVESEGESSSSIVCVSNSRM